MCAVWRAIVDCADIEVLFPDQLCYTRGSVIPCIMTVEASDPQALDLLSAPRSPVVRLLRHVTTGDPFDGGRNIPTLDFERDVQELTAAVWHPDTEREPHRRVLHGEIHLSTALKPTCRLGKFELTVSARRALHMCIRGS